MKDFFKYLAWGLLGLSLSLALPQVPVSWAAIVLAQAYLQGLRRWGPWLLLLALAGAYSAFSLNSAFSFAAPWALAWLLCLSLRKPFQWEGPEERALVLALLSVLPILSGGVMAWGWSGIWLLDWKDWLGAAATFVVGFFGASILRRLADFLPRRRRVDLSRADWISVRASRLSRKPFGLEKGL